MPYYTEQDRLRAVKISRNNRRLKQILENPEDRFDILGIKVPKVTTKPTLSEFGLREDVEDYLRQLDEESVSSQKSIRSAVLWILAVSAFFFSVWTIDDLAEAIGIYLVVGLYPFFWMWGWATDISPKMTDMHRQYEEYKGQLRYYNYWLRKKSKNYWNRMSGHSFELAVANLFRSIGYSADVSKRGGDGGVDIVLQKNNRHIAVQCKRYKNVVGPHVVRDLWGTMDSLGYSEGCVVTTTGFSKGVKEFVKGKKIYLIDLNDILRTVSEGENSEHLRRKIGE